MTTLRLCAVLLAVMAVIITGCSKEETAIGVTAGVISGKIVNTVGAKPIASASISTIPATTSVVSDSTGGFVIPNVTPGTYSLNVLKTGFSDGSETVTVNSGQTVTVVVALTAGNGSGNGDSLQAPGNPTPGDGAAGQPTNLVLQWEMPGATTDSLTYDLYFDTNPAPNLTATDLQDRKFIRNGLTIDTKYYWRVVVKDRSGKQKSSPVWSFSTTSSLNNNPPSAPVTPTPVNGAASQPYAITLRWTSTDPDGDPLKYDLLFGTSATPNTVLASDLTSPSYAIKDLAQGTTYYWQIVAKDNHNGTTTGPVWSFTVKGNLPPNAPNSPRPVNGAADQPINLNLQWSASDDDGDPLKFDLYMGTNGTASNVVATDLANPAFVAQNLQPNTTYSWRVTAKDGHGGETSGQLWSFTTADAPKKGLLAFYPFNGNAVDASNNGHNGEVIGATLTADRFGTANSAYSFNGSGNYIQVPHAPALNAMTNGLTVGAWVKYSTSQVDYAGIVAKGPRGTENPGYMLVIMNNTKIGAAIGQPGFVVLNGTQDLNDNKWHFFTVVMTAEKTATLYVDGQPVASKTETGLSLDFPNTEPLYIGADRNTTQFFRGAIDDVRIYNYPLTAAEVQALANQ